MCQESFTICSDVEWRLSDMAASGVRVEMQFDPNGAYHTLTVRDDSESEDVSEFTSELKSYITGGLLTGVGSYEDGFVDVYRINI